MVVAVALCAAVILARRILREPASLTRLERAARAYGVALPAGPTPGWQRDLVNAAHRCACCAHPQRCEDMLAAGDLHALRGICANSGYFEQLKQNTHRIC